MIASLRWSIFRPYSFELGAYGRLFPAKTHRKTVLIVHPDFVTDVSILQFIHDPCRLMLRQMMYYFSLLRFTGSYTEVSLPQSLVKSFYHHSNFLAFSSTVSSLFVPWNHLTLNSLCVLRTYDHIWSIITDRVSNLCLNRFLLLFSFRTNSLRKQEEASKVPVIHFPFYWGAYVLQSKTWGYLIFECVPIHASWVCHHGDFHP